MRKPKTIAFLEQVVMNDALDAVHAAIRATHDTSGFQPKSLIITGPSGVGKTTLIQRYKRKLPTKSCDDRDRMPVLMMEVPPSSDLRSFQMQMLRALRHPRPDRKATLGEMRVQIVRMIQALGVELIVVDEFQDVLPRLNKNSSSLMKLLKHFMNTLSIPWVLVGLPESSEILESGDGQLRRRFSACRRIEPFSITTDPQLADFQGYLATLEKVLPFPCHHLDEIQMVLRMYCATQGLPGLIANIMERLIEGFDGDGKATLAHFAKAYREAFLHDVHVDDGGASFNPFSAELKRVKRAVSG